ncbi:MAG: DUF58 domain-containing protein [Lachnospiraceae bacterium]|nr:DUF58 domain-containing protein [Lachnospiraceae bacterium]MDE7000104.1 DUF58 domain-containing protein [Lachnospiraceae bacterium]
MIFVMLLGALLVGAVWGIYYRCQWAKDVTVRLWFETDAVYAGQETKLYEVIENRKRMPVPVLEVGFHTRKELDFADVENTNVSDYLYKRDVFSVLGRQKITREIPVKCTKRGRYLASDADITTHTLLYRKHYSKAVGTEAEIYVYPKMTDVSEIVTVCEHMLGTIQCARRLYEDPFAFRTIRNYTTDDPMKSINWKASARTGSLMVNTFDSVQSQKAMIFLDVEDTGILKYEDLVEESIALAATVMRRLIRQNIEVGFVFNGRGSDVFFPENNRKNRIAFERMLAEYDREDGAEDFGQFVRKLFSDTFVKKPVSEDTLFLFITKNLKEPLMECIRECAGEHQTLVIVPVPRGERSALREAVRSDRDNVFVLAKEVERT